MIIGFDAKRLFCNYTGLGNYSRTLLQNQSKYYPDNEYFLYSPKIKKDPVILSFLNEDKYNVHISNSKFKANWRSHSIIKQLKKDNIKLFHGLSNELPLNIHKSGIKI